MQISGARYLIADSDVQDLVRPVEDDLRNVGTKVAFYSSTFFTELEARRRLPDARRAGLRPEETANLIYTSGTTGLPKATILRRGRELSTGNTVSNRLKLKPSDCMYTCMPLYHGAAHGLCVTPIIHAGSTVALGRKFSHRTFWPEVCRSKATILQYVGELCRYLLNSPPSELDRAHNVKMAWGNGMRPDVWEPFRQRFGIPVIHELYAATDGMGFISMENKGDFSRGALGVRGLIWNSLIGRREIQARVDPVTEELVRGNDGFAQRCGANEPGEVLHKLDPANVEASFAGYFNNETASQKRLIRDVFEEGDL